MIDILLSGVIGGVLGTITGLYVAQRNRQQQYYINWIKSSSEHNWKLLENNPYFEGLRLQVNAEGQRIIRKKLFQTLIDEDDLNELVGISEYDEATKKLRAAVSAL